MSRFTTTLRRAVLASIIAGSLATSAFAGHFDNFRQAASQAKQKFSSAKSTVKNVQKAAAPFKSTLQSKITNLPSQLKKFTPSNLGSQTSKLKLPNKLPSKPGNLGIAGGVKVLRDKMENGTMAKPSDYSKNKLSPKPFPNGNLGITGKGMPQKPVAGKITGTPAKQPTSKSHLRSFNIGDIVSAPADLAGSAVRGAGNVIGGPVKKATDTAANTLDTTSKIQKGAVNGIGNLFNTTTTKNGEPRGSTTQVFKKVKTEKPIKAIGKAKVKPIKAIGKAKLPVFDPNEKTTSNSNAGKTKAEKAVQIGQAKKAEDRFKPVTKLGTKPSSTEAKKVEDRFKPVKKLGTKPSTPTEVKPTKTDKTKTDKTKGSKNRFPVEEVLSQVLSNLQQAQDGSGMAMDSAPEMEAAPVQYAEAAPQAVDGTGSADLVLIDAKMVKPATKLAGPAYAVRLRNQGLASSGGFMVAAVNSNDGTLSADAAKAQIEIPGLAAGETKDVVLRMPQADAKYLILMLDADGLVSESDKENNTAIVERSSL